jgi:hypothetical protein
MAASNEFTVREFFQLAKEAAEHEAELKIRLHKAGVLERDERDSDDRNTRKPD